MRSDTTEKQNQDSSKNLNRKEHFRTQALMRKLILLVELFLTLFRMGFFGAAHGWGEGPLPKICHTYPTMMKLGKFIPYPKKIEKIYE